MLAVLPLPASAWNIPGHMLSAAIAYQVLRQENPQTIDKVTAVLEKHPWYANQWQARLQDALVADRDMMLFMQASRWADDIRMSDKAQNRPPWHYVNLPFKPEGTCIAVAEKKEKQKEERKYGNKTKNKTASLCNTRIVLDGWDQRSSILPLHLRPTTNH
jgi:hypothetical protein